MGDLTNLNIQAGDAGGGTFVLYHIQASTDNLSHYRT